MLPGPGRGHCQGPFPLAGRTEVAALSLLRPGPKAFENITARESLRVCRRLRTHTSRTPVSYSDSARSRRESRCPGCLQQGRPCRTDGLMSTNQEKVCFWAYFPETACSSSVSGPRHTQTTPSRHQVVLGDKASPPTESRALSRRASRPWSSSPQRSTLWAEPNQPRFDTTSAQPYLLVTRAAATAGLAGCGPGATPPPTAPSRPLGTSEAGHLGWRVV